MADVRETASLEWEGLINFHFLDRTRGQEVFDTVIAPRYAEPHRHYHTLEHVVACIETLDSTMAQSESIAEPEIELALWFHDIVYNPLAKNNEEESADLLLDVGRGLHLPEKTLLIAADIIVYTKHAMPVSNKPASYQYAIDADLSILGESESIFDKYEADVRKEYELVPDSVFWPTRCRILQGFLDKPIYNTREFKAAYEEKARANLARSIALHSV